MFYLAYVSIAATATAKSLQPCLTVCDPRDGSPPGSPVPGILQARTLEWVAISFSDAWKWKVKVKSLSRVRLLATQWTAAYQAPPSMGFSRKEYWSGVPLPSPSGEARSCKFLPNCIGLCQGWGFPDSSAVKNPPAMQELQETQVHSLGWKDSLEEGMATHSSFLAWRIPMDRGARSLQSIG